MPWVDWSSQSLFDRHMTLTFRAAEIAATGSAEKSKVGQNNLKEFHGSNSL